MYRFENALEIRKRECWFHFYKTGSFLILKFFFQFNSRGPYTDYPTSPKSRSIEPRFAGPYSATLPKQRTPNYEAEKNMSSRTDFRNDKGPPHRGYYTLGSDTRSSKHKPESNNISDYGVAISIKGIKGNFYLAQL